MTYPVTLLSNLIILCRVAIFYGNLKKSWNSATVKEFVMVWENSRFTTIQDLIRNHDLFICLICFCSLQRMIYWPSISLEPTFAEPSLAIIFIQLLIANLYGKARESGLESGNPVSSTLQHISMWCVRPSSPV